VTLAISQPEDINQMETVKTITQRYKDSFLYERTKGKQLVTSPAKKGHFAKDAYFAKQFIHIFEKDAYCDYISVRRKQRNDDGRKLLDGRPFIPSSGSHKP
jgi:hypothetical protein